MLGTSLRADRGGRWHPPEDTAAPRPDLCPQPAPAAEGAWQGAEGAVFGEANKWEPNVGMAARGPDSCSERLKDAAL